MCKSEKLVAGVGINDCKYSTENPVRKEIYNMWCSMLSRCSDKENNPVYKNYKDVSVCDEWLTLSKFRDWVERQDWEGKELDKDILSGVNKIYSPDTCLFVSREVNVSLILGNHKVDRDLPVGVSYNKVKDVYQTKCGDGSRGQVYLGTYKTAKQAHVRWQMYKCERLEKLISKSKDVRLKEGLRKIVRNIREDFRNGRETTQLIQ